YILLGTLILVITILCFSCSMSKKTNVKKISDSSEAVEEHFIIVPDLKGKTLEEAKALLSKRGLEVEKSGEEYSAFIPKDKISSQSPLTNDTAIKGTKITVKISKGPQAKKK
ncbi:MAG: PASTA domain-containing protein, partial [Clostridium sp.]|nr:PASTA domain-containing protein [Clostridium sp.]